MPAPPTIPRLVGRIGRRPAARPTPKKFDSAAPQFVHHLGPPPRRLRLPPSPIRAPPPFDRLHPIPCSSRSSSTMAAETPREITHETIKGMYCFFFLPCQCACACCRGVSAGLMAGVFFWLSTTTRCLGLLLSSRWSRSEEDDLEALDCVPIAPIYPATDGSRRGPEPIARFCLPRLELFACPAIALPATFTNSGTRRLTHRRTPEPNG